MTGIPQLPTELLERILWFLPIDPRNIKESVRVLCSFGAANSRFLLVSRLSSLWKDHYEARWSYFDPVRDEERKRKYGIDDFATLYRIRGRLDADALDLLESVMNHPNDREMGALSMVERHGLDVWDALKTTIGSVNIMDSASPDKIPNINLFTQGLTRRYWAKELSCVIARNRSIALWAELCANADISFEKTLAALSAFFGYDVEEISRELDRLAGLCRCYLQARNVSQQQSSVATAAEEICKWMREYGFKKPSPLHDSDLMHNFIHHVLFELHMALPISLVYVFTSVARRLGYDAHPVAFPYKVLAVILPHEKGGERTYVDVYDSSTQAILSYSQLPSVLQSMGFDFDMENIQSIALYTEPARSSVMLLRAVKNIISSLDRALLSNECEHIAAHCAAYCAGVLLTGDGRLVQHLFAGSEGPLDRLVTLKHHLRPYLTLGAREQLEFCLHTDSRTPDEVPRAEGREGVQHYVGMFFRHKRYDYVGVIKGWDYHCDISEDWIHRMRIDDLPGGREQPFYNTYTLDGRMRYVAEEHIIPLTTVDFIDISGIVKSNRTLGRWFDGVEVYPSGRARLIQSKESKFMFPDDEAVALQYADIAVR